MWRYVFRTPAGATPIRWGPRLCSYTLFNFLQGALNELSLSKLLAAYTLVSCGLLCLLIVWGAVFREPDFHFFHPRNAEVLILQSKT